MTEVQERAWRTRQRVLDAAAEEFAVHGYSEANLGAVVARTGMTKGALYGHFPSKQHLASELVREVRASHALLRADPPPADGRPTERRPLPALAALLRELAGALREDTHLRAVHRLMVEAAPEVAPGQWLYAGLERRIAALVVPAQSTGAVAAERSPEAIARLLLTVVLGTHLTEQLPGGSGLRLGVDRAWELLLAGLAPRTAPVECEPC